METTAEARPAADQIVVACAHCGQKNRVVRARGTQATCGKCGKSPFHDHPVDASDASWHAEVEESALPVLVDFWAPWCGPCRAVAPVLARVASERLGRLKVVKLNVDDNPQTAARFGIQAIPSMLIFRGGQLAEQIRGAVPKATLDQTLDRLLG